MAVTDNSLKDQVNRLFQAEPPKGVETVFAPSQTRTLFENLWNQAGHDTSDLWNQGRFWEGRTLLGRGDDEPQADDVAQGAPDGPAESAVQSATPEQQFQQIINDMTPEGRAFIEQQLNEAVGAEGRFSLEQFASSPSRFMQEYSDAMPQDSLIRFEQGLAAGMITGFGPVRPVLEDEGHVHERSHDAMAFDATATTQEGMRIHKYLQEKENSKTLAGQGNDENDEDVKLRRMIQQTMVSEMILDLSQTATNLAQDILNYKALTPEEIAQIERDISQWQEDLAQAALDRQRAQTELAQVEQRIDDTKKEIAQVTQEVEQSQQVIESATSTIQSVQEARQQALAGLGPAYQQYYSVRDEAIAAMGMDPAEGFIYRNDQGQYVMMNLDFTTNEGGTETLLEGNVPQEVIDRLQQADARIDNIWETATFHGESLDRIREFIDEERLRVDELRARADELRISLEQDQSRAAELQSEIAGLDTQIIELQQKIDQGQLQLDMNDFMQREDIQDLAKKLANPRLHEAAKNGDMEAARKIGEYADQIYEQAPENVRAHMRQTYPQLFDRQNAAAPAPAPGVAPEVAAADAAPPESGAMALEQGLAAAAETLADPGTRTATSDATVDGQGIQANVDATVAFNQMAKPGDSEPETPVQEFTPTKPVPVAQANFGTGGPS